MGLKYILPGSLEMDGNGVITAGVHEGPTEWDTKHLRYIRAPVDLMGGKETVGEFLSRIYDNSTGCLVLGRFRLIEGSC